MTPPQENLTFEDALQQLEQTVRVLESGETGLDEALAQYESGVGLLKHCYQQLRQAEQRILLLTGQDEQGQPLTQPFRPAATVEFSSDGKKAQPPRRKKPGEPEKLF